jgi:hypothetical protein
MHNESIEFDAAPRACEVHSHRCSEILHVHHSPPQSWKPSFTVKHYLDPTSHEGRLHYWIDWMIRNDLAYPRGVSGKMRELLEECFTLAKEQGLTPKPTL